MYSLKAREEEIKSRVREDYFGDYDCSNYLGNIDFSVAIRKDGKELFPDKEYLMWAEAKHGDKQPLWESLIQLIFTIGKEKTNEKALPPKFLGAFDAEKIAMIPFSSVMEVFSQNDFNWNVAPSDHNSKEFALLKKLVRAELDKSGKEGENVFVFYFDNDSKELKKFIRKNFVSGRDSIQRMRITHNNFKAIYERWRKEVMPSIAVDWDSAKKHGLLDADFYLADVMSGDNNTLLENLHVLLQSNHYELDRQLDADGLFRSSTVKFKDNMKAHSIFWSKYSRPPKREYWDKIVERRDLLVPQDVRERKGSFFTPRIWVEKSQEYLANVLGEDWQDEYYIWDCCAGTGNLLANLTNKYNIWASTLDKGDVQIMKERIAEMGTGSNLLESHVFQFDFLNDDFEKLPKGLLDIIQDEEKRKKLVIYINPPYAEAGSYGTNSKSDVSKNTKISQIYKQQLGLATNELYAQFLMRINKEIHGCFIANFSTLKIIQAPNFLKFRQYFKAELLRLFIVPAYTFDNVKGKFPIGFYIWEATTAEITGRINIEADVLNERGQFLYKKRIADLSEFGRINDWFHKFRDEKKVAIGFLHNNKNDFQTSNQVFISSDNNHDHTSTISVDNLREVCIYLAVRQSIEANWTNDRDQFLYPNRGWIDDIQFQTDCLIFTLFHGQNKITSNIGTNHWIPFTEQEVDSPDCFKSHVLSDYIKTNRNAANLFSQEDSGSNRLEFSPAAQAVLDAGKALWYYYLHHKDGELYGASSINVNASFYDIRKYFQGVDEKGKMNSDSPDQEYMRLIKDLRDKQKVLAKQIEEKVYKYGFLYNGEPREDDDIVEVEAEEVVTPAVVKKEAPIKKKNKEQTIIVQNIQVNGDLNVQTLIGSADIKK